MARETTLTPKKSWQKLLIYWHTKNHSTKVYDIARILAVSIFTNKTIYEEELEQAQRLLFETLQDEDSVKEVMAYIEMKLADYASDIQRWHDDQKVVRTLIQNDEELYSYMLEIFEADAMIDLEEAGFEDSLKKSMLRS